MSVYVLSQMVSALSASYVIHVQCFKLKFFRSRLLATFFCKIVAARKILVAKNQSVFKAGHLMLPFMK